MDPGTLQPAGSSGKFFTTSGKERLHVCNNPVYLDKEGYIHRIGGPAYVNLGGDAFYRIHGKLHRLDGPAIDSGDNSSEIFYIS